MMSIRTLALVGFASACSGKGDDSALQESDADTDSDSDTDTDSDTDADTDSDTDADTDSDTDADSDADPDKFVEYTAAFGFDMVPLAAGTFTMGTDDKEYWESNPAHEVTLTRGFWIARTETTQLQYDNWTEVFEAHPSAHAGCDDCPVEQVNWMTAHQYANAASVAGGLEPCYVEDGTALVASLGGSPYACQGYRLPTEAEWEYAARAGEAYDWAGSNTPADVAWTFDNTTHTHEVAKLAPNAWELYDLSGNVMEWTDDWFGFWEGTAVEDPTGPKTGTAMVFRGGSFNHRNEECTVYKRDGYDTWTAWSYIGFRLVRTAP